jgi:hypothetical protein
VRPAIAMMITCTACYAYVLVLTVMDSTSMGATTDAMRLMAAWLLPVRPRWLLVVVHISSRCLSPCIWLSRAGAGSGTVQANNTSVRTCTRAGALKRRWFRGLRPCRHGKQGSVLVIAENGGAV